MPTIDNYDINIYYQYAARTQTLEAIQEEQIQKALEPKEKTVELDNDEREAALALLRDPKLLDRILVDFERCGVVGEETNKLTGYLAAVSRKLEEPLAVIIQSTSAAGKSALMDAVLAFMPEEERVQYSAMGTFARISKSAFCKPT